MVKIRVCFFSISLFMILSIICNNFKSFGKFQSYKAWYKYMTWVLFRCIYIYRQKSNSIWFFTWPKFHCWPVITWYCSKEGVSTLSGSSPSHQVCVSWPGKLQVLTPRSNGGPDPGSVDPGDGSSHWYTNR